MNKKVQKKVKSIFDQIASRYLGPAEEERMGHVLVGKEENIQEHLERISGLNQECSRLEKLLREDVVAPATGKKSLSVDERNRITASIDAQKKQIKHFEDSLSIVEQAPDNAKYKKPQMQTFNVNHQSRLMKSFKDDGIVGVVKYVQKNVAKGIPQQELKDLNDLIYNDLYELSNDFQKAVARAYTHWLNKQRAENLTFQKRMNEMNRYHAFQEIDPIEDLLDQSKRDVVVVVKHKSIPEGSNVTSRFIETFKEWVGKQDTKKVKIPLIYRLNVDAFPELSEKISIGFNVEHQVPQFIILKDEKVIGVQNSPWTYELKDELFEKIEQKSEVEFGI